MAKEYLNRGWFLVHAEFPEAMVVLATPKTAPKTLVCGVIFDYSNYDAQPPSVRLVDPFTCEPYKISELPTRLMQAAPGSNMPTELPGGVKIQMRQEQPLMQENLLTNIPFLCIAGVREYHSHPAHSGDHWERYRSSGAGQMVRILEIIHRYGVEPIVGLDIEMKPIVRLGYGPSPA